MVGTNHGGLKTYGTVQHTLTLVPALLDVALERTAIQWLQQLEGTEQLRADTHDGTPVVELAAVIGRTEDRYQDPLVKELIAILDHHVCSADQVEVVFLQELHDNFLAEAITDSALIGFPISLHICWIGPKKIVEKSVVGDVGRPSDIANVIHVAEGRTETTMNTENLACHNCSNWKGVECVDKCLPDLNIATSLTLIVEAVHTGNIGAFVVAAKQEEVLGVTNFVAQKQQNGFETLFATVDIVTEEQEVAVGWKAAHLEHTNKIGVLTVYVANNLYWWREFKQSGLREEDLASSIAHSGDLGILEADSLSDLSGVASINQAFNHIVDVGIF